MKFHAEGLWTARAEDLYGRCIPVAAPLDGPSTVAASVPRHLTWTRRGLHQHSLGPKAMRPLDHAATQRCAARSALDRTMAVTRSVNQGLLLFYTSRKQGESRFNTRLPSPKKVPAAGGVTFVETSPEARKRKTREVWIRFITPIEVFLIRKERKRGAPGPQPPKTAPHGRAGEEAQKRGEPG